MSISIILIIVYAVSISLVLIFALIGASKGLWKTTIALLVQLVLFFISIFVSPSISRAIGGINLQNMGLNTSFIMFDTTIYVSSVRDTVCQILTASGYISPLQGQTIYLSALAITDSVLSLVVYIILAILSVILGWFIGLFLYHIIFKFIIPKRIRKKHPLKLYGLLAGSVMGLISATLLIAPFSSLSKIVKNNEENINKIQENASLDSNVVGMVKDFGNSIYSNGWFLDDWMLSNATNVSLNNESFNFKDVADLATNVATPFASALNSKDSADLFNYTILMAPDTSINLIIDALISSNFIMEMMPAIFNSAMNYVSESTSFDASTLDFSSINYTTELGTLKEIYKNLYSSGLITDSIENKNISFSFSQEDRPQVIEALKNFGNLQIVQKNLPYLCALSAENLEKSIGYRILSTDPNDYLNINWSDNLQRIGNTIFDVMNVVGDDLTMDVFSFGEDFTDKFYEALKNENNVQTLVDSLCGNSSKSGLLDTDLLGSNILNYGEIANYLFASVPTLSQYVSEEEFVSYFSKLDSKSLQEEVQTIFDLITPLRKISDISYEKTGDKSQIEIDLKDEETVEQFQQILNISKNSSLIKAILPSTLRKSMGSIFENVFGSPNFLGISPLSFDFDNTDALFDDLNDLLEIISDLYDLSDLFSTNLSTSELFQKLDISKLKNVLNVIVNSDVLNPDLKIDNTGRVVSNNNVASMFTYIFSSFDLSQYGFSIPTREELRAINWKSTSESTTNEIDNLCNFLQSIKNLSTNGILTDSGIDVKLMSGTQVADIISSTANSEMLSPSLVNFLNTQFNSATNGFGLKLDFTNVSDWNKSSEEFGKFFDLVKPWINDNNYDFKKLKDSNYLNAILTQLNETGFASPYKDGEEYVDPIGDFIFYMVNESNLLNWYDVVIDKAIFYSINPKTGLAWEDKYYSHQWSWIEEKSEGISISSLENPSVTIGNDFTVTTKGEIYNLSKFVSTYFDSNLDVWKGDNPTFDIPYDTLLNVTIFMDQSHIFRNFLPNTIETITKLPFYVNFYQLDNDSFDMNYYLSYEYSKETYSQDRIDGLELYIELFKYTNGGMTNQSMLQQILDRTNLTNWNDSSLTYTLADGTNVTGKEFFTKFMSKIASNKVIRVIKEDKTFSSSADLFEMIFSTLYLDRMEYGYYSDTLPDPHNIEITYVDGTSIPQKVTIKADNTLEAVRESMRNKIDSLTDQQLIQEYELIVKVIDALQGQNINTVFASTSSSPETITAIKTILKDSNIFTFQLN